MSARVSLALIVLLWLFGRPAHAAQWILSRAVEKDFVQFIQNVESGKVDPELKTADVAIESSSARVDLVYKSGAKKSFVLQKPAEEGAHGFFAITPASGATADDVQRLAREFDAVFKTSPWTVSRPMSSVTATEPKSDVAGKSSGGSNQLARWLEADVGKSEVVGVSIVVAVLLLFGAALAWLSPVDLGRGGDNRS
jgi:hypothetical protein